MTDFFQLSVAGISIGSIYAMVAIGFVLLWQTSNTINFAQGEFVVVPAFTMVLFMDWKELEQKPTELIVETQEKRTWWDTWAYLLAFVAVISTEWYLRKRWGLV